MHRKCSVSGTCVVCSSSNVARAERDGINCIPTMLDAKQNHCTIHLNRCFVQLTTNFFDVSPVNCDRLGICHKKLVDCQVLCVFSWNSWRGDQFVGTIKYIFVPCDSVIFLAVFETSKSGVIGTDWGFCWMLVRALWMFQSCLITPEVFIV